MVKELYRIKDSTGEIIITQSGDKRIMTFGSDLEQSSILMEWPYHLTHEYTQVMLLGLLFTEVKHATLLGLGGGGLLHCLHYFFPEINIQAVEFRQAVIDIAYKWFELPRESNINVYCSDAYKYLKNISPGKTDLIFSDLYETVGMSEIQAQQKFIKAAHKALSESGWLIINFHQLPDKNSTIFKQTQTLFSEVYVCDIFSGNWVVFCGKSSLEFDQSKIADDAWKLGKNIDMPMAYYYKQLRHF